MSADLLSHIRIVLSHTSHPGNIGATARAMKTMGIVSLYLVNPKKFSGCRRRSQGKRASDVLHNARVCASLAEALRGTVYALAVSARRARARLCVQRGRAARRRSWWRRRRRARSHRIGTEMSGLTNDEILQCRAMAHIPADPGYSSSISPRRLQVMAYEARVAALAHSRCPGSEAEPARHEDVENFYLHLEQSLLASGFLDPANPRRLIPRLRRLLAARASSRKRST